MQANVKEKLLRVGWLVIKQCFKRIGGSVCMYKLWQEVFYSILKQ